MVGVYETVDLLAKDRDGRIVPWSTSEVAWGPTSNADTAKEAPLTRLKELFNVNHLIVSQANPIIAPFLPSNAPFRSSWIAPIHKLKGLLADEIRHRMYQVMPPLCPWNVPHPTHTM
jgi:hypothetical protein